MRTASHSALARPRRVLGHLLTATLAALGTLSAALGAGLSLIGLCCGGGALVAAGAGTAATGTAVGGPAMWLFQAAGAALITAAWLVRRRQTARRDCCPPRGRPGAR
ncbi:hypothetical protein NLX86_12215 [Streptomyces sp. A3M-1-3]|uniref:hypothetical protein n=1 Tax=Streptomyces sp. A3M-1-3 TaxID=2962044 RepID=UPI0020B7D17F|nr:hypothetical protein [Streptomyces sp. A3M-1-3]MCP3818846.1 hypothetical protein [Streptomyces sp. A3M-1-3]